MPIGSVISAGATILGAIRQRSAGRKERSLAKDEAKLVEAETEELLKRTEREQERISALARARASASGASGATLAAYLTELGAVQQEELDWIKRTGKKRAKLVKKGGDISQSMGNIASLQSVSQAFGFVPQIVDAARRGRWWA